MFLTLLVFSVEARADWGQLDGRVISTTFPHLGSHSSTYTSRFTSSVLAVLVHKRSLERRDEENNAMSRESDGPHRPGVW
jgi:hypothetical protein